MFSRIEARLEMRVRFIFIRIYIAFYRYFLDRDMLEMFVRQKG